MRIGAEDGKRAVGQGGVSAALRASRHLRSAFARRRGSSAIKHGKNRYHRPAVFIRALQHRIMPAAGRGPAELGPTGSVRRCLSARYDTRPPRPVE